MSVLRSSSGCLWNVASILLLGHLVCFSGEPANVASAARTEGGFSYEMVREKARALAATAYRPESSGAPPEFLKKLNYDEYQAIRFRLNKSVWQEESLGFTLQFFHPGFIYQDPVVINLIEEGIAREFKFSPDLFDYGTNALPKPFPAGLRFAGLKLLYPLNLPAKQDEVASFVGASYFRLLGSGQKYGASARGLAINTAEPGGEEFPRFTELWIEKPNKLADRLQLFALLDSPSVAGAYRFVIKPGETTTAEIEIHLFIRKDVNKIGIAPLTSMFLQGETRTRFIPDFRPEVHDSDGLSFQIGVGGWLWRPLINPEKEFHISRFPWQNARGFGLLQRDRDFRDYQDLEARYDLRPSLWVEPLAKWDEGTTELVEIPTPNEFNDNIVAYWVPKDKLTAGRHYYYSYTLSAMTAATNNSKLFRVLATRIDPPHDKVPPRFVIDFSGGPSPSLPADAVVTAKILAAKGETRNLVVQKNEVVGGWRVFFDFVAAGNEPSELRLFLQAGSQVLSETWIYNYFNP